MKKWYFFNGRSWRGLGVVWWRRGPARSAPMQRGARFFQKQCFPCSVALVLGRGGAARSAPMQRGARFLQKQCFPCSVALVLGSDDTQTIKQTINQTNHKTDKHTNNQTGKHTNNQTHNQSRTACFSVPMQCQTNNLVGIQHVLYCFRKC